MWCEVNVNRPLSHGRDHASTPPSGVPPERIEEFVRLVGQHQRRLHHFVAGLIPFPADADDVVQDTQLVLWREFDSYQSGTNFYAWACSVAFHQVLAWRKRRQRDRIVMSEEFLAAVAKELVDEDEKLSERNRLLAGCVAKLPAHHRELLRLRYSEGGAVEVIAAGMNRTADAVYRMLSRIRTNLFECVNHSLTGASAGP